VAGFFADIPATQFEKALDRGFPHHVGQIREIAAARGDRPPQQVLGEFDGMENAAP
jgi:hypothetical protein